MVNIRSASKILGWMSDEELTFLAETAKKSKVIFEAGSYMGRSTRAMADNTKGVIFAIDPWNSPYIAQRNGMLISTDDATRSTFYCNLYTHIKNRKVLMCPIPFTDFNPAMKADFIFIDAMHEYEPVKKDIEHALKFLNPGGILAGHDYCPVWTGVVQAVDEKFPKINVVDTIWWLKHE